MADFAQYLLQHLPLIERVIQTIGTRNGMAAAEIEEFGAEVRYRLVKDDYAILRAYRGRSTFAVYIAAVVRRMLLDYRNHLWGKWRPSAEAKKMGDLAVEVERMAIRDGRPAAEVVAALQARFPTLDAGQVEAILLRLPQRFSRRTVDLDEASSVAAEPEDDPARVQLAERISEVVRHFIDELPSEDQLIFRLRFEAEMTVAQIARSLHLDQTVLYRRLYKHYDELRALLGRAGIGPRDIDEVIGSNSTFLDFRLKNRISSPSDEDESEVADRQEETSS